MATISLSYFLICLMVWEPQTKAASIPLCWSKFIATVCKSFDQVSPCTLHHIPLDKNALLEPQLFLMPPVMIWSPLEQFHSQLVSGFLCPTCEDAQPLQPHGWRDGSKERLEPRKIHGMGGTILLVGRIYKCSKGHEIVGYNPKILEQIPLQHMAVPFCLWHRTGFSRQFMDVIVGMVSSGISISETHKCIKMQACNQYWKGKSHFKELKTSMECKNVRHFHHMWNGKQNVRLVIHHGIQLLDVSCLIFGVKRNSTHATHSSVQYNARRHG